MIDWVTVLNGDCRTMLRTLPAQSVQCVVTSPPYYGLRKYGTPPQVWDDGWRGELGQEPTPKQFVAHLVEVFREVHRVLRDDGVMWVNLGDSYNAAGRSGHGARVGDKQGTNRASATAADTCRPSDAELKPKDLMGIPWRMAFALQEDGWFLRSDTIWSKPNPMTESVKDRPTKAHEYVFLLSKQEHYFYDRHAIAEPAECDRMRGPALHGDLVSTIPGSAVDCPRRAPGETRNRRSVWTITPASYSEAHFATMPEELARLCILAGSSGGGCCGTCGAPRARLVETTPASAERLKSCGADANGGYQGKATKDYAGGGAQDPSAVKARILAGMTAKISTGWAATCGCPEQEPVPCAVLDPFAGSGTTLAVAVRHDRRGVGVELNPGYVPMIRQRCQRESGLFAPVQFPVPELTPEPAQMSLL